MPRPRIRVGVTTTKLTSQGSAITVTGSATQAFAPTDISGLVAWYDFSDATTLFTDAGSTNVSTDGDAIQQVTDKSGNATLTQTTAINKPTYKTGIQNGHSIARFDGGDYLGSASIVAGSNTAQTIITVAARSGGAANFQELGNIKNIIIYARTAGSVNWAIYDGGEIDSSHSIDGAFHLIAQVSRNFNDVDLVTDGASENKTTGTSYASRFSQLGGAGAASQNMTGDIGEFIGYDIALSSTQLAQVTAYLKAKWATP